MRLAIVLTGLAGFLLATLLVGYYGLGEVGSALLTAGWSGLLAVSAAHLLFWLLCGLAWWSLLPGRARVAACCWARWLRDAGSDLLPLSSVGGDLMGARAAVVQGIPAALALGSTVVDVTLELLAQLAFTLVGLAILLAGRVSPALVRSTLMGLVVAAPLVLGFVCAQRIGLFLLLERGVRLLAGRWRASDATPGGLNAVIREIYSDRRRLAAGFALHFAGWFASAGEAWLALHCLGADPGILAVLAIESLAYALRSAAFVVPGAVGVQEGGYVLLAPLFGLTPEIMLALSLLKRGRDLALGVPALLAWQGLEGGRWWRRRAAAGAPDR